MDLYNLISEAGRYCIRFYKKNDNLLYKSDKKIPSCVVNGIKDYEDQILRILNRFEGHSVSLCPLSYNQQSMWFSYFLNPDSTSYNVAIPIHITDKLDITTTLSTIQAMVNRFDQLRTIFDLPGENYNIPVQLILDEVKTDIIIIDSYSADNSQTIDSLHAFYKKPFNINSAPSFRVLIQSNSSTDHYILFVFHHIIIDAFSVGIFLKNFEMFFLKQINPQNNCNSYSDFVFLQQEYIKNHGEKDLSFFKNNLSNGTYSIPVNNNNNTCSSNGATTYFNIEPPVIDGIRNLAKTLSVTPFSIYLAAFQLVQIYLSGIYTAPLGVVNHGRTAQNIGTFGNFINPLPLHSVRNKNFTIKDHIKSTFLELLDLQDHSMYPFSLLVEKLSPDRNGSSYSFFDELFNMNSMKQLGTGADFLYSTDGARKLTFCGLNASPVQLNQQEGQFRLTMELLEYADKITGILKFRTDCFNTDTISEIINRYQTFLLKIPESLALNIETFFNHDLLKQTKKSEIPQMRIVVASTFTSEPLNQTFKFWSSKLSIELQDLYAPYNQLFHQLNDPSSELLTNNGINVITIRIEDFCNYYYDQSFDHDLVTKNTDEFIELIERFYQIKKVKTIIIFCPISYGLRTRQDIVDFISTRENHVKSRLNLNSSVICITSVELLTFYNNQYDYEPASGIIGHVPYTEAFYTILGTIIVRTITGFQKPPCKLIIVDCDNTLWSGVAGEDTIENISIPPSMKFIQNFLKSKKDAGVLLGICSKNNEIDTLEIFKKHPEMILSINDFSFRRINWEIKSKNISDMLKEASLSTSGVFFIDDSPSECAEVMANCPGVTVIQLPSDINLREPFLKHFWPLDNSKVTNEDHQRHYLYMQERRRNRFKESTSSFSDFINGLNLSISIRKATFDNIARISRLSFRTNQFTLGITRYTEEQICTLMHNSDFFIVDVTDRFGSYGTVGVIQITVKNNEFSVDTFLLSCRALGRGVEHRMASFTGNHAEHLGFQNVSVSIAVTDKNVPLRSFFYDFATDYLNSKGESFLHFKIPSPVLKTVRFDPDRKISGEFTKQHSVQKQNSYIIDNSIYLEIATKYSDPKNLICSIYPNYCKQEFNIVQLQSAINLDDIKNIIGGIFSCTLDTGNVNHDDNFFDIGGKSILIPSLISQINKALHINLSILDIFQYPTIISLSEYICRKVTDTSGIQL
ncbi:MAG: HAD-IIIC family phosphatase [Fibrobacter sp.]|nr:HAD-IIIC family phosphatase [Fibrobacter sp.]